MDLASIAASAVAGGLVAGFALLATKKKDADDLAAKVGRLVAQDPASREYVTNTVRAQGRRVDQLRDTLNGVLYDLDYKAGVFAVSGLETENEALRDALSGKADVDSYTRLSQDIVRLSQELTQVRSALEGKADAESHELLLQQMKDKASADDVEQLRRDMGDKADSKVLEQLRYEMDGKVDSDQLGRKREGGDVALPAKKKSKSKSKSKTKPKYQIEKTDDGYKISDKHGNVSVYTCDGSHVSGPTFFQFETTDNYIDVMTQRRSADGHLKTDHHIFGLNDLTTLYKSKISFEKAANADA